jgi:enoyl-CoA hydratase/carnithine racemase
MTWQREAVLVKVEKKGGIARIELGWRAGHDEGSLYLELADACEAIKEDETIRVVLVVWKGPGEKEKETGEAVENIGGTEKSRDEVVAECPLAEPIASMDLPVVGCIMGDCIGAPLELMMACDIRVAADDARFGVTQVSEGIIPNQGGTQRLSRLVGLAKALEMILTAEVISAGEAHRLGLVNRLAAGEGAYEKALELSEELAGKAPIAVRYTKEALHKGMDLTLDQGLRMEGDLYLLLYSTADRTEGIEAFKEKRQPHFVGE